MRKRIDYGERGAPSLWITLLLGVIGLSWVAAFQPKPEVLATAPALVAMLIALERCERFRHVLLLVVVFGALGIGYGYRWLASTVEQFSGGMVGSSGAMGLTALFGIIGTVHILIFAMFYRAMVRSGPRRPHPLVTVALWVACECLPIRLFPWMAGHGAIDVEPLAMQASWGGVAGVSFALLCLIVPLHDLIHAAFMGRADRQLGRTRVGAALVTLLVGGALYGWGVGAASDANRASELDTAKIAIVQANIGAVAKREATEGSRTRKARTVAAYERGSRTAIEAGADLVVWPETAITDSIPLLLAQVRRDAHGRSAPPLPAGASSKNSAMTRPS